VVHRAMFDSNADWLICVCVLIETHATVAK
jgi:hypothetical protein